MGSFRQNATVNANQNKSLKALIAAPASPGLHEILNWPTAEKFGKVQSSSKFTPAKRLSVESGVYKDKK